MFVTQKGLHQLENGNNWQTNKQTQLLPRNEAIVKYKLTTICVLIGSLKPLMLGFCGEAFIR